MTDAFTYYSCDGCSIMFTTKEGTIVSDNYFADMGRWDSITAIKAGTEKLLYGNKDELLKSVE